jgi:hypothetical protein
MNMNYLARLKQLDDGKISHNMPDTEPTKPSKAHFVGFDGTGAGHIEKKIIDAADERVNKMVAKLADDPGLIYAMQTHDEVEPDAVILTVAIRDKGACELRIPKSRYDGFALMELIEKHTTRETLQ